jgi:hypothetical protein
LEVVPLIILIGELTCSESISGGDSGFAMEITHALDISLSEIQAQHFRDSDTGDEVEHDVADEWDHLQEDLQERERFDKDRWGEHEWEIHSYYKDGTF